MDKTGARTRKYHKTSTKVTALILAVVLAASLAVNSAVTVRLTGGDASQAAENYLLDNTEYVNQNRLERLAELAGTLKKPTTLQEYYELAGTQIAKEDYEGALSSIRQCLKLYYGGDRDLEKDLRLKKACLEVLLGREDDALTSLEQVLRIDDKTSEAYLIRAQIYAGREEMEPLALALEEYLTLKPGDAEVRELLAQALFTGGDYDGAAGQYRQILQAADEDQDVTQTQYLYGMTCVQSGDFESAVESLSAAREKDAALDGIDYYLGVSKMSLGDYSGAEREFTAAIGREDMTQASYYSRGLCRLMGGSDESGAMADVRKAADMDKTSEVGRQAADLLAQLTAAKEAAAAETARLQAEKAAAEEAARIQAEKDAAAQSGQAEASSPAGSSGTEQGGGTGN